MDAEEIQAAFVGSEIIKPEFDFGEFLTEYADQIGMASDDPMTTIVRGILGAATMDDALGADIINIDDLQGANLIIHSFTLQRSTKQQGNPYYAVIAITLRESFTEKGWEMAPEDEWERILTTTGATSIIAQLLRAAGKNDFPFEAVVRVQEIDSGNTVKRLVKPAGKLSKSVRASSGR